MQVVVATMQLMVEVVAMVMMYILGILVIHAETVTVTEVIWMVILKEILLMEMIEVILPLAVIILAVAMLVVVAAVMATMTLTLNQTAYS